MDHAGLEEKNWRSVGKSYSESIFFWSPSEPLILEELSVVGREGFEPPKVEPAGLQPALVDRLSTDPKFILLMEPLSGIEPETSTLHS